MSETISLPTPPPPAAKKAKVHPGRPRLGEIYLEEKYDFNDCVSELEFDPPAPAEPGAEEAVLKSLRQPKGVPKNDWKHLQRRWKLVIIFSCGGMITLALLWFLLTWFFPQATWLNKHVPWNQPKKGSADENPSLRHRFWSESAEDVSASPTVSIHVLPPTVTVAASTVETSSPSVTIATTVSTPESTIVLVPISFVA